jgi:hypothetical protein
VQSRATKQSTAEERFNIFSDEFNEGEWDAAWTLRYLVLAAGDYLGQILGKECADAGMAVMLSPFIQCDDQALWRERLEDNWGDCYAAWPLAELFLELTAYARFGIVPPHGENDSDLNIENHLEDMVLRALRFFDETPLQAWVPDRGTQQPLIELIMLVKNRWALDHGEPIDPPALALFGGVSESRIRNLMAGADSIFNAVDKKIPAQQALSWLAERDVYLDSIWREQTFSFKAVAEDALETPLFVPVARDGSIFHPGLDKGAGYKVGAKGEERVIKEFNEALVELQRMPTPYWRRPNRRGKDGMVRGVDWRRYDLKTLMGLGV